VLFQILTRLEADKSAITLMRIDGAALRKFIGDDPSGSRAVETSGVKRVPRRSLLAQSQRPLSVRICRKERVNCFADHGAGASLATALLARELFAFARAQ
jgi:hypothetical protein